MAVHIRFLPHPVINDTLKLYTIHLPSSVEDPGEGPGGPTPPYFLTKLRQIFLGDRFTPPPASKGLNDPPPPLSQGLDPSLL